MLFYVLGETLIIIWVCEQVSAVWHLVLQTKIMPALWGPFPTAQYNTSGHGYSKWSLHNGIADPLGELRFSELYPRFIWFMDKFITFLNLIFSFSLKKLLIWTHDKTTKSRYWSNEAPKNLKIKRIFYLTKIDILEVNGK